MFSIQRTVFTIYFWPDIIRKKKGLDQIDTANVGCFTLILCLSVPPGQDTQRRECANTGQTQH